MFYHYILHLHHRCARGTGWLVPLQAWVLSALESYLLLVWPHDMTSVLGSPIKKWFWHVVRSGRGNNSIFLVLFTWFLAFQTRHSICQCSYEQRCDKLHTYACLYICIHLCMFEFTYLYLFHTHVCNICPYVSKHVSIYLCVYVFMERVFSSCSSRASFLFSHKKSDVTQMRNVI